MPDSLIQLYKRARLASERGNYQSALHNLEIILEKYLNQRESHLLYADIAWRLSRPDWDRYYEKATSRNDSAPILAFDYAQKLIQGGFFEKAERLLNHVDSAEEVPQFSVMKGHIAYSKGDVEKTLYFLEQAKKRGMDNITTDRLLYKALLKEKEFDGAIALGEKIVSNEKANQGDWAALATGYKLSEDNEQYSRLYNYDDFLLVSDALPYSQVDGRKDFLDELKSILLELHDAKAHPIEQSLRNGSQTEGHLFAKGSLIIKRLSDHLLELSRNHLQKFSKEENHPFYRHLNGHYKYTGSWSVKLNDQGFHKNHFHNSGLISGCFYIDVPSAVNEQGQGWLKLGEDEISLGTSADLLIKPKPGRVVLFPSYMWHGTTPFKGNQHRLTVAFDINSVRN